MSSQASPDLRCIGDYRPSAGGFCNGCGQVLPHVMHVSDEDERNLRSLIAAGRTVDAIKLLHDQFELGLADSKLAVHHMTVGGRRPLGPPCTNCGTPLRTPKARMCAQCGTRREPTSDVT